MLPIAYELTHVRGAKCKVLCTYDLYFSPATGQTLPGTGSFGNACKRNRLFTFLSLVYVYLISVCCDLSTNKGRSNVLEQAAATFTLKLKFRLRSSQCLLLDISLITILQACTMQTCCSTDQISYQTERNNVNHCHIGADFLLRQIV